MCRFMSGKWRREWIYKDVKTIPSKVFEIIIEFMDFFVCIIRLYTTKLYFLDGWVEDTKRFWKVSVLEAPCYE